MNIERCSGIIPLRWQEGAWSALIVKLHSGNHWSFPKGHNEPGEDPRQTAQRELLEETGLFVLQWLPFQPLQEDYQVIRNGFPTPKTVIYFIAEVAGEVKVQEDEIADFQWVPLETASEVLTYPPSKQIALEAARSARNFNKHLA